MLHIMSATYLCPFQPVGLSAACLSRDLKRYLAAKRRYFAFISVLHLYETLGATLMRHGVPSELSTFLVFDTLVVLFAPRQTRTAPP